MTVMATVTSAGRDQQNPPQAISCDSFHDRAIGATISAGLIGQAVVVG